MLGIFDLFDIIVFKSLDLIHLSFLHWNKMFLTYFYFYYWYFIYRLHKFGIQDIFIQTKLSIALNKSFNSYFLQIFNPSLLSAPPLQELSSELLLLSKLLPWCFLFCANARACFFKLCTHNLCKVYTIALPFLRLGPTCTPMTLGWSAVFIKTTALIHVLAFEWPPPHASCIQCNVFWSRPLS